MAVVEGIHVVQKRRKGKEPIWYIYAHRGGPQIYRQIGWKRPNLNADALRKLVAAHEARIEQVKVPETLRARFKSFSMS